MRQNDGSSVSEQALAEQKKRAKRERAAEKRRKKTHDKPVPYTHLTLPTKRKV